MSTTSRTAAHEPAEARGFTLIELLVAIAVVGVLVALLLPALQRVRESARRASCLNHLKQIGVALENYHGAHAVLPPGYIYFDRAGARGLGWGTFLLPHLEQASVYHDAGLSAGDGEFPDAGDPIHRTVLRVYICPSDAGADFNEHRRSAKSNYVGILGSNGASPPRGGARLSDETRGDGSLYWNSSTSFLNMHDGASNTLLVAEVSCSNDGSHLGSRWIGQYDEEVTAVITRTEAGDWQINGGNPEGVASLHAGGAQVLLADGSSRFVSESIHAKIWRGLGSIHGGEVPGEF